MSQPRVVVAPWYAKLNQVTAHIVRPGANNETGPTHTRGAVALCGTSSDSWAFAPLSEPYRRCEACIAAHNRPAVRSAVVERLRAGYWQFGHGGRHNGNGTPECPRTLHHHCDEFCEQPTLAEMQAAGVDPAEFAARSRA